MTQPDPRTLALWFSDEPDPVACTPLPYCAVCTEPPLPVPPQREEPAR